MIKVIIERQIATGMESTYDEAIKDTLRAMLEAKGYVSGATYKDAMDSNHRIIITNWKNQEAWHLWFKSEDRRNALASIQPILQQEEKVTMLTA